MLWDCCNPNELGIYDMTGNVGAVGLTGTTRRRIIWSAFSAGSGRRDKISKLSWFMKRTDPTGTFAFGIHI